MAPSGNPIKKLLLHPNTTIVLIGFYFVGCLVSIFNYSFYLRFENERYGEGRINAFLAFTIIGGLALIFWSGGHWMWAAKYSDTQESKYRHIALGFGGIFLLHDLPLFMIEYSMVLCCGGLLNGWQGLSFVYIWVEFIVSFIWAWTRYAWWAAKWLQKLYGQGNQGVTFMTHEEWQRRSQSPNSPEMAPGLPMTERVAGIRSPLPPTHRQRQPNENLAVDPAEFMAREMVRHPQPGYTDVQKGTFEVDPPSVQAAPYGAPSPQRYLVEQREVQPRAGSFSVGSSRGRTPTVSNGNLPFGASPPYKQPSARTVQTNRQYPPHLMPQPSGGSFKSPSPKPPSSGNVGIVPNLKF